MISGLRRDTETAEVVELDPLYSSELGCLQFYSTYEDLKIPIQAQRTISL